MAQFTKVIFAIPDLHPAVTMHALLVGLKPSPFLETLYADPPPNMDSLRARVAKYMSIEESIEARKKKSHPHTIGESSRFQKRVKPGRYDRYTPLNATREAVLQEACSLELICLPHSRRTHPSADPTLRCNYHQNIGHNTKECTKVQDLI